MTTILTIPILIMVTLVVAVIIKTILEMFDASEELNEDAKPGSEECSSITLQGSNGPPTARRNFLEEKEDEG